MEEVEYLFKHALVQEVAYQSILHQKRMELHLKVANSIEKIFNERPEFLLTLAVKRMLPKSPLGRQMLSKLKAYADSEHPHQAQQPKPLEV